MNCQSNAVMAATLANNGTCPITGEKIFDADAVQHVRSLMYSCGMAIYSGQFAFNVNIDIVLGNLIFHIYNMVMVMPFRFLNSHICFRSDFQQCPQQLVLQCL